MLRNIGLWLIVLVGMACPGASIADASAASAAIPVFVSILPQAGFVAEIGGDQVAVSVLVGPGHSPATYEPTPHQMVALSGARLFFCAGVPFERPLLPKIKGLPRPPRLVGPCQAAATHHPGHHHGTELDPHTWLDPVAAQATVDTISAALSQLLPAAADEIAARADHLKHRLQALDTELATQLAPYRGRRFFVFHPAYGHFAERYGLVQVAVEAGGHEPGARQLAAVIDEAKAAKARVIVVQPQFSRRTAETVAKATGAEILVLDPLAGDYEANLRHIATALAAALKTGT